MQIFSAVCNKASVEPLAKVGSRASSKKTYCNSVPCSPGNGRKMEK